MAKKNFQNILSPFFSQAGVYVSPTCGLALLGKTVFERRTSFTRRDPTVYKARSRLVGLEISHINATWRAGPFSTVD